MDIEGKIYFDNFDEKGAFRIDLFKDKDKDVPCVMCFLSSKKIYLIKSPDSNSFDFEDIPFLQKALSFLEKHIK